MIQRTETYAIHCDGPSCQKTLHHPRQSIDGLRLIAESEGWARLIDERFYCPECEIKRTDSNA